jgi:hypothetical protein
MNVYLHVCIFFSQYTYINVFACRYLDTPNRRKYATDGKKVCSFFTTRAVHQGKAP